MNNPDPRSEALRWLRFAGEDLGEAESLILRTDSFPRHACWLAQQAVEKAIKAILILEQIEFPRRHDLDALRLLLPDSWQVKSDFLDLAELTEWSMEARYPGDWPEASLTEALNAVQQARSAYAAVEKDFIQRGYFLK